MPDKNDRIIRLDIVGFKRIEAVHLKFDESDNLIVVGGDNANGKTSTLDAIPAALGGKKAHPARPIKDGAESSEIVLETEKIIVEKIFEKKDGEDVARLHVYKKEGGKKVKVSSAQTFLDEIVGDLAMDPLPFVMTKPGESLPDLQRRQRSTLLQLAGIDFSALDTQRQDLYAKRRDVARDAKELRTIAESVEYYPDSPAEPVSIDDLLSERAQLQAVEDQRKKAIVELSATKTAKAERIANMEADADSIAVLDPEEAERLEELRKYYEKAVADTKDQYANRRRNLEVRIEAHKEKIKADDEKIGALAMDVSEGSEEQLAEIDEAIREAQSKNEKASKNRERLLAIERADAKEKEASDLSAKIEAIDKEKKNMVKSAKFPVEGLSVDDDGVIYNGQPISQASSAEQLRIAMSVSLALHKDLKVVLIRDGSLLDMKSLQIVRDMATEAGAQVFLERVSMGDEVTVIIEDGRVKGS